MKRRNAVATLDVARYPGPVVVRAATLALAFLFLAVQVVSANVCRCAHAGPCGGGATYARAEGRPQRRASYGKAGGCCGHCSRSQAPGSRETSGEPGNPDAPERPCTSCRCVAPESFVAPAKVTLPADSRGALDLVPPASPSGFVHDAPVVTALAAGPPGAAAGPPSVPCSASPSLLPVLLD